jgi:hypothetical protein
MAKSIYIQCYLIILELSASEKKWLAKPYLSDNFFL